MGKGEPVIDWQGRPYDPKNGPAAHPNSRFTVSAEYNPSYTKEAENPQGVPISAIVFGGRRRETAPLVYRGAQLGSTACWSAPAWHPRPPPPPPARWASCAATRWR